MPVPPFPSDLVEWRLRPARAHLRIVGLVVLLGTVFVAAWLSGDDGTRLEDVLDDGPWALWTVPQGAWLAALVLCVTTPRLGVRTGAVVCALEGLSPYEVPWLWFTSAAVLGAVVAVDGVAAARQHALARSVTRGSLTPDLPEAERGRLSRPRPVPLAVGCLLVLAGAVLLAVWWMETESARDFYQRGEQETGTIVAVADDGMTATVEIHGIDRTVRYPAAYPVQGEVRTYLVDPDTARIEDVRDVSDPSGWLFLASACLVVSLMTFASVVAGRREMRSLLATPSLAWWVVASVSPAGRIFLAAPETPDLAFARTGIPVTVRSPEPGEPTGPIAPLTTWRRTPVLLVGLKDGGPAALRGPDGSWHITRVLEPAHSATPLSLRAWWKRLRQSTGSWLPWFMVPGAFAFMQWMAPDVGTLKFLGFVVGVAFAMWGWNRNSLARLCVVPSGLIVRGTVLDELLPWSRIREVTADASAVVIRLQQSDRDRILVEAGAEAATALLGRSLDPVDVARRLEQARAAGSVGRAPVPTNRVLFPSVPLLVAVAWVGALTAGYVSGL